MEDGRFGTNIKCGGVGVEAGADAKVKLLWPTLETIRDTVKPNDEDPDMPTMTKDSGRGGITSSPSSSRT